MRKIILFVLVLCFLPVCAQAQSNKMEKAQKLYTNLRLSFLNLFFGKLSGQCEFQLGKSALNLSGNVSLASGQQGYQGGMSYRYYFSQKRTSAFFSLIANFSDYKTKYEGVVADGQPTAGTSAEFKLWGQTLTAGANIGYRQNILGIFNITGRLGYGYPIQINDLSWQNDFVPTESRTFTNQYLLKMGIDAELSIGWRLGGRR